MNRAPLLLLLAALACDGGKQARAPSAGEGARTFALVCARCHGADGTGGLGKPPPRNFTDPAFQSARTDDELRAAITGGKNNAMPAFGAALTPFEIESLIAHVRSLKR